MTRALFHTALLSILLASAHAAEAPGHPLEGIDCLWQYPAVHALETGQTPGETPAQRAAQTEKRVAARLSLTPERVKELLKPCAEHLVKTEAAAPLDRARAKFVLGRYDEARLLALEAGDKAHRAKNRQPLEVVAALQLAAFAALETGAGEDVVKYIGVAAGEVPPASDLALWSQLQAVSARAYELMKMPRDQEQTLRHILSEHERRLGESHADTVRARSELAAVLYLHGRDEDAERQSRLVLRDTLRLHGSNAAQTQVARKNLARVLEGMGRHADAEPLRREVLATLREAGSGASDSTLTSAQEQLVKNLVAQGRHMVAEPEAMALAEMAARSSGKDSLTTLDARLVHARAVLEHSRHEEAAQLLAALRQDCLRALGAEHRVTLSTALLLGSAWNKLERHAEARPLLEETLAVQRRTLPADDLETLETRHQLGLALWALGQRKEALAEIRIALFAYNRLLKPGDPRLKAADASATRLASTEEGKTLLIQEKRETYQKALKTIPKDDPGALNIQLDLAAYIEGLGCLEEALAEYKDLLANCQRLLGPGADGTCTVADKMAVAEIKAGKFKEAADRLRVLLATMEKRHQPGSLGLEEVRFHLGYALKHLGSLEEAEPLVLRSYEACKGQSEINAGFIESMRATLEEIRAIRRQQAGPGIGTMIAPTKDSALPDVGTLNKSPGF